MAFSFETKKFFHVYHNTVGLQNDAKMLVEALGPGTVHQIFVWEHGAAPAYVTNDSITPKDQVTIVFYEHILKPRFPYRKVVFIPNPDWFTEDDVELVKTYVDEFWHKTSISFQLFQRAFPDKKHQFIGWASQDLFLPEVKVDYNRFMVQVGAARRRQLDIILQCWINNPDFPPLTITAYDKTDVLFFPFPMKWKNITVRLEKMSQSDLCVEMNRHGMHLCLGLTEGFGHYINEARSVKGIPSRYGPPISTLHSPP